MQVLLFYSECRCSDTRYKVLSGRATEAEWGDGYRDKIDSPPVGKGNRLIERMPVQLFIISCSLALPLLDLLKHLNHLAQVVIPKYPMHGFPFANIIEQVKMLISCHRVQFSLRI